MSETALEPPPATRLRVPPHSIEAEVSVLGSLMLDPDAWDRIGDKVHASDFYRSAHKTIFEAIAALVDDNAGLDPVTVAEALQNRGQLESVGGNVYLAELVEATPGSANIATYAQIIKERSILRQLLTAGGDISEMAFMPEGRSSADLINTAEQRIFEISEDRLGEDGPQPINPLLKAAIARVDDLEQMKGGYTGVETGFTELDNITSGLQQSDLVIVAARPSMGKTAFIVNMAEHMAMARDDDRRAVLVFSMEQPTDQIVMRILSSHSSIDQTRLRTGKLSAHDWDRLNAAIASLKDKNLHIDDTASLTANDVRMRARRVSRQANGLKAIFVDYIQLMHAPGRQENRNTEISEITRSLKAIAKEMKCPLIACSQLNRSVDARPDRRPRMSDLRDSGAIEQDADLIMFIYRDVVHNPDTPEPKRAEIIVSKHRNGPIGDFDLTFEGTLTRFENDYEPGRDVPPP